MKLYKGSLGNAQPQIRSAEFSMVSFARSIMYATCDAAPAEQPYLDSIVRSQNES